jgi:hypothetical protein
VNQLQDAITALLEYEETMVAAIVNVTRMNAEDVKTRFFDGKDHYLSAKTACELGLGTLSSSKPKFSAPRKEVTNGSYDDVFQALVIPEKKFFGSILNFSSNSSNSTSTSKMKTIEIKDLFVAQTVRAFEVAVDDEGHIEMSESQFNALTQALIDARAKADKCPKCGAKLDGTEGSKGPENTTQETVDPHKAELESTKAELARANAELEKLGKKLVPTASVVVGDTAQAGTEAKASKPDPNVDENDPITKAAIAQLNG